MANPSLLDVVDSSPAEWYLLYSDKVDYWFQRPLQDGFTHVDAARFTPSGWVVVAPHFGYTDVQIIDTDMPPWSWHNGVVQRVQARRRDDWQRSWGCLGPVTCVEIIKSVLGVRKPFILTPYQLFKYCKKGFV